MMIHDKVDASREQLLSCAALSSEQKWSVCVCGCVSSALQIHPASVEQKAGRRCSCRAFCLCLLFSMFRPPGLPPLCRHRCLLLVSFTSSSLSSPRVSGSVRTCLCLPPSCVCLTICQFFVPSENNVCALHSPVFDLNLCLAPHMHAFVYQICWQDPPYLFIFKPLTLTPESTHSSAIVFTEWLSMSLTQCECFVRLFSPPVFCGYGVNCYMSERYSLSQQEMHHITL